MRLSDNPVSQNPLIAPPGFAAISVQGAENYAIVLMLVTSGLREPRPLTGHGLWSRIKTLGEYLKSIGILKRELQFTPHLFRRTYATLLYKSGMKLKAIMQKTRHANIEVLAKHYINDDEPASPYFDRMLREPVKN